MNHENSLWHRLQERPVVHLVQWLLGIKPAFTQTSEAERDALARHASGKKQLAEIGVWHGVTTCRLRWAMDESATLFAIDPYRKGKFGFSAQKIIAQHEVGRIARGSIVWLRMTGVEAAVMQARSNFQPAFDFLFIDADHSYEGVKGDWENWSPLITSGGIVALHDSHATPQCPIDDSGSVVYTQSTILHDQRFRLVEVVDSLTVLERL